MGVGCTRGLMRERDRRTGAVVVSGLATAVTVVADAEGCRVAVGADVFARVLAVLVVVRAAVAVARGTGKLRGEGQR